MKSQVMVSIPCFETVRHEFAASLAVLMAHRSELYEVSFQFCQGTIIPHSRRALVESAINAAATHIMFFDSDMTFPPDTIDRLLVEMKLIIGAAYCRREAPYRLLGKLKDHHATGGLTRMENLPLGCMLIDLDIFQTLSKPWFNYHFGPTPSEDISEDIWFCRQAAKRNITVYRHDKLTLEVGHVGRAVLTFYHTEEHHHASRNLTS